MSVEYIIIIKDIGNNKICLKYMFKEAYNNCNNLVCGRNFLDEH